MANIQPNQPHTIGNAITEAEAAIRERLAVLESAAKADEQKAVAWIKANWPHVVTWATTAASALKLFGKI